jgi:hypothetical protein
MTVIKLKQFFTVGFSQRRKAPPSITGFSPIKKGKIVGSYLSFINLNLIVELGRTALLRTFFII